MSDQVDLILEGAVCESCGEFFHDDPPGHPRNCEDCFSPHEITNGIPDAPKQKPPRCPRCRRPMKKRFSQANQQRFWGCSQYPECRGSRPYELSEAQKQPRHSRPMPPTTREFTPSVSKNPGTVVVVCEGSGPALAECPF